MTRFKWGLLAAALLALLIVLAFVARSMFGSAGGETAAEAVFTGESEEDSETLLQQERAPDDEYRADPTATAEPGDQPSGATAEQ